MDIERLLFRMGTELDRIKTKSAVPKSSLFLNSVVRLRGGIDGRQDLKWVEAKGPGQYDELDNINPPLSAFASSIAGFCH